MNKRTTPLPVAPGTVGGMPQAHGGAVDGRMVRVALGFTGWAERWFPDAFVFALAATFLVLVAA